MRRGAFDIFIPDTSVGTIQLKIYKLDTLNCPDIYVGEQNLTTRFGALAPF